LRRGARNSASGFAITTTTDQLLTYTDGYRTRADVYRPTTAPGPCGWPLLIAVLKPGQSATADEIRGVLADKVAKWWLPDDVVFVDELPHTATGKLSKLTLRQRFRDHVLPTALE